MPDVYAGRSVSNYENTYALSSVLGARLKAYTQWINHSQLLDLPTMVRPCQGLKPAHLIPVSSSH
jgi:hypothetical protein